MSITIDPTVPPNTESPRNGATRIRNLAIGLLGLLNLPTASAQTIGGPFITSLTAGGVPTFPTGSAVASDPTAALGIASKQYVDSKVSYAVSTGGDAYVATISDINSLITGQSIIVKFNAANTTTSPTLNLNALGATPIKMADTSAPNIGAIAINGTYDLVYDGATTTWVISDFLNPAAATFPLTADVSAGSHRITSLAAPTTAGDALSFGNAISGLNSGSGSLSIQASVSGTPTIFIVNWGVQNGANVNGNTTTAVSISFATAYASSVFSIVTGPLAGTGAPSRNSFATVQIGTVGTTGFTLQIGNSDSSAHSIGGYWLAIGV